jgi:hypothetical protein
MVSIQTYTAVEISAYTHRYFKCERCVYKGDIVAGSKKWFIYTTDDGTDFALLRDESNVEGTNAGTQDYPDGGTLKYALPRNVKPRRIYFSNPAGTIRREVVCLTQTIFSAVAAGSTMTDQVSGTTLQISLKKGEEITIPKGVDTGLNDGDAT